MTTHYILILTTGHGSSLAYDCTSYASSTDQYDDYTKHVAAVIVPATTADEAVQHWTMMIDQGRLDVDCNYLVGLYACGPDEVPKDADDLRRAAVRVRDARRAAEHAPKREAWERRELERLTKKYGGTP